ncbi:MAG: hypothetical protein NTZ38_00700 [Candidatus Taylorbacteria bacterium]|nr:hypothetical protein [Candidatus Taylorbacteria bacterium]
MKQFTTEEIKAQYDKLPPEVQTALSSVDINRKIQVIANNHGLHIDQMGELIDEVGLIMLGLIKSSDFASHIISRCEINKAEAEKIAVEINTEVFASIRKFLQEMEETNDNGYVESEIENTKQEQAHKDLSALESAGDFKILNENGNNNGNGEEKSGINKWVGSEAVETLKNATSGNTGKIESQSQIISEIEKGVDGGEFPDTLLESGESHDDQADVADALLKSGNAIVENTNTMATAPIKTVRNDPVADHLMKNTVATNMEKIIVERKETNGQTKSVKRGPNDPYREPV